MSWRTYRLGEICTCLSGGTPSKANDDYWSGTIPWVSAKDLIHPRIYDAPMKISEEAVQKGSRLVPENTVLFVVRGMSLANEFRISLARVPLAFNQDLKALKPNENFCSEFIFYSLYAQRKNILQRAGEASHGTKKLPTQVIEDILVQAPNLNAQEKVVSFIRRYDDLIENNRRRIQLLEESACLLYREWFVQLRFPGHEHVVITNDVPEGWEQISLGQYSKLNYGKALKAENRVEGDFAVYGSSGVVGSHNAGLVKGPTIIVGRKGNVGSVYWSSRDCWPIDTVYFIDPNKANLYLYYALQFMQFINTDVAVPGLNRDLAHSRPLMIPSPRILNEFLLTAAPIHQQIEKLEEQNQKLTQARDLLLPRLMNGEITV